MADSSADNSLSAAAWRVLACPQCGGALSPAAEGAACVRCGTEFGRAPTGQLDLRLRRPKTSRLEVTLPAPAVREGGEWGRLPVNPAPEVDVSRVDGPCHLPWDLRTWFPRARSEGALALDLGCGSQVHKRVCELAGFEYVGLDYATPEAMLLGDAQALPFADGAFELVVSIAVLEHVRFPLLMMREAFRVLRPGGRIIGTVAFLEPFHQDSFHHHTHLGTLNSLRFAGFDVEQVAPSGGWSGLEAQANMGLFPGSPRWLSRLLVWPLLLLHRLWWRAGRLFDPTATEARRMLKNSGAILFLASKR